MRRRAWRTPSRRCSRARRWRSTRSWPFPTERCPHRAHPVRRRDETHQQEAGMQYALTIYDDQSKWSDLPPDSPRETSEAYGKLTEEMRAAGVFRAGEGLQPATTATTVRVPNGE